MQTNAEKKLSVVITRYGENDEVVKNCLESLSQQKKVITEVIFLEQRPSAEIEEYAWGLDNSLVSFEYIEIPARSLSFARNYGLKQASSRYVAFCDADCVLANNWSEEIYRTFAEKVATIVGTKIVPRWEVRPSWYHQSKFVQEFYSLIDLSDEIKEITKVVGASFAIDKKAFKEETYFDENLGRQKGKLLGGEETDLCQRIRNIGGKVMYTPHTFAYHCVSKERMNLRWLTRRAYFGGISRAIRGGKSEPFNQREKLTWSDKGALILIILPYLIGFWTKRLNLNA